MENAVKRTFRKGERIYVIDYFGTVACTQAFVEKAEIVSVNKKKKTLTAVLYDDTYQTYNFNDYGRLIFDTPDKANDFVKTIPLSNTTVYQIIGKKVYKKIVKGIRGSHNNGIFDLVICLKPGKDISIKEIGQSLFLSKEDAIKNKK